MLKQIAYSALPAPIRIQGRQFFRNLLLECWERCRGEADPELPPHYLNISGRGGFRALGNHNVWLCKSLGQLQPTDHILDVGCGIGRTAIAMSHFLSEKGSYCGIDVVGFAIRWCRNHIGKRYPKFRFLHADVVNKVYNPHGKVQPERYTFPFESEEFTFILSTSLFTHLLPAGAENYLREISRTLNPGGGRFLSTWFLLDEVTASMENTLSKFPYRFACHAQCSLDGPERAVAYNLRCVEGLFARCRLEITAIKRGGWSGAASEIDSGQDVIVAKRSAG